jgi:hypothetical protein
MERGFIKSLGRNMARGADKKFHLGNWGQYGYEKKRDGSHIGSASGYRTDHCPYRWTNQRCVGGYLRRDTLRKNYQPHRLYILPQATRGSHV